jgi:hypothetical protein
MLKLFGNSKERLVEFCDLPGRLRCPLRGGRDA